MCNFYRGERKREQKCKYKLKIWENLGNDQRKIPVKVKASLKTLETHSAPTPVERNFVENSLKIFHFIVIVLSI